MVRVAPSIPTARSAALLGVLSATSALLASHGCVLTERELGANLTCEQTECRCTTGWADCDGNLDNGCEQSLGGDPANCGACGHDCLGGECLEGHCQPFVVYETAVHSSISLVLGQQHLYWREERRLTPGGTTDDGTLLAMALDGGEPARLASGVPPTPLAVGNDVLYWTEGRDSTSTNRAPPPYGLWLRAASAQSAAHDVAVVSTQRYFTPTCLVADDGAAYIGTESGLLEVDAISGSATPLATWQSPCAVMVRAGDFVAWMDESMSALHRFDVVRREEESLPTGEVQPPWEFLLAASPTRAYWAEGTDPWFVRSLTLSTGELANFSPLQSAPSAIAVAEPWLYVGRSGAGVIEALALTGGEPVLLASGQPALGSLLASPNALYFSAGKRIQRLAR